MRPPVTSTPWQLCFPWLLSAAKPPPPTPGFSVTKRQRRVERLPGMPCPPLDCRRRRMPLVLHPVLPAPSPFKRVASPVSTLPIAILGSLHYHNKRGEVGHTCGNGTGTRVTDPALQPLSNKEHATLAGKNPQARQVHLVGYVGERQYLNGRELALPASLGSHELGFLVVLRPVVGPTIRESFFSREHGNTSS